MDEKKTLTTVLSKRFHAIFFAFILSFLIIGLSGCGQFTYNDEDGLARDIFHLVNLHRTSMDLNKLEWNEIISSQCRLHSQEMSEKAVGVGHDGIEQRAEIISEKISFSNLHENVGYVSDLMGISSPASRIYEEWLKSSEHRKIIEGKYDLTGVGVVVDGYDYYFTQIFVKTK